VEECKPLVGASSQIVPLYLSEVSPAGLRGTLNGFRRMAYVIGCLMAGPPRCCPPHHRHAFLTILS
jgi:hypothetical protein